MKKQTQTTISSLVVYICLTASAQSSSSANAQFRLYVEDKSCVCISTKKQTKTITAFETRSNKFVYQVFRSRFDTKRELFRVKVGRFEGSEVLKLWNYGIAEEADFNGDGLPDYSWYGGDDTSSEMYLFLSSTNGYVKVDLIKTLRSAWKERFHSAAPDLAAADCDYQLQNVFLRRSESGLVLLANIGPNPLFGNKNRTYSFRVGETNFMP